MSKICDFGRACAASATANGAGLTDIAWHGTEPGAFGRHGFTGRVAPRTRAAGGATRGRSAPGCVSAADIDLDELTGAGWRGPEVLWEQVGLPARRARRRRPARAQRLPAAAAAVPGRGDHPRPGLRGVPGGLRAADAAEVPGRCARAAARSAERVICVSEFTRQDVVLALRGRSGQGARGAQRAVAADRRRRPCPSGEPYVLGRRRPAGEEELAPPGARRAAPPPAGDRGRGRGEGDALRALGAETPGYVADARAGRADARRRRRWCTRRCTRATGWWWPRRWRAACPSPRRATTALPEAGGDAGGVLRPARRRRDRARRSRRRWPAARRPAVVRTLGPGRARRRWRSTARRCDA